MVVVNFPTEPKWSRTQLIQNLSSTCLQSSSKNSQASPSLGVMENTVSFACAPSPETAKHFLCFWLGIGGFPACWESLTHPLGRSQWALLSPTAKNTTLALFPGHLTVLMNSWTTIFQKNKSEPLWRLTGEGAGGKWFPKLVFLGKHSARACSCSLSNFNPKQHFSWQKKSEKIIRLRA